MQGDAGGEQCEQDVMEELKKNSALFILGSKERFKLTQVATQGIIEGVTNLMQVHLFIYFLLSIMVYILYYRCISQLLSLK